MQKTTSGFTIVELLIVIVIIAILAVIGVVAYGGVQDRARDSKVKSDLANLTKAIRLARDNETRTMVPIVGSTYTASPCVSKPAGTDLAALPNTDSCWTTYATALNGISNASGVNVRSLVDPWGRPYFIDANEGEGGTNCNRDVLAVYALPTNGATRMPGWDAYVPLSGYSGCAV